MSRSRLAKAALILGAALSAGCTTASLSDVSPQAAVAPKPDQPGDSAAGPTDTGTYPNLNVKPQAAASQLSDNETASGISALKAAKAGQGTSQPKSAAEIARLKKLARTHGQEALEEIEE